MRKFLTVLYTFNMCWHIIRGEVRKMLIQFNFKNFKSYRDDTSLDMTATSIKEHQYNVIENVKGDNLLKVAAIYGANASGKTGVIEAFNFMQSFVVESFLRQNEGKGIPLKRFAFGDKSRNNKAEFEVFFIHEGTEYQYGFTIDNQKVYEEYLYRKNYKYKDRYDTLYERTLNDIVCGEDFKQGEKVKELIDDATLFLTLTSKLKVNEAKKVYEWFRNCDVVDFGNSITESSLSRSLPIKDLKDKVYLTALEKFMNAIDVGIDGIRIEENKDMVNEEGKPSYRVYSKHKDINGTEMVEILFTEESSGTQKMFVLYRFLMDALKHGTILFIDELDAKLHPLLLRYIISMFHNPNINKNNAQLVYTTHDIYTLTKETFRRDEIWFAEKDKNGVSSLYSLAEYKLEDDRKVRNDATYNKEYLLGRYGAIPLLKEFNLME